MSLADEIRTVQRLLGVEPDGVAGPRTIEAMRNALDQLAALKAQGARPTLSVATPAPVSAAGGVLVANGGLSDPARFFDAIKAAFGTLDQAEVDGFNALIAACAGWPLPWAAYAIATAWHETAHTMQPVAEAYWLKDGPRSIYLKKMYDIQGDRPGKARELGNLRPGDGVDFAGRGYVQLTGRANYEKASRATGTDLIVNPDRAMQPDVAAKILRWGMEGGHFTGKKLADHLPPPGPASASQFREARRIINGLDRADDIAALAMKFQAALLAGGWQ